MDDGGPELQFVPAGKRRGFGRTHTITGLTEGEVYFVRVVAVNAVGDSDRSNLAYGTLGEGSGSYEVLEWGPASA